MSSFKDKMLARREREPTFAEAVQARRNMPEPPPDDRWEITKGFTAGVDQVQAIGGGLVAAAGDAVGSDSLREWGTKVYEQNMAEAAESRGRIMDYREVYVPDDPLATLNNAADYALYGIGNLVPTMAPALVGGGVGAVAVRTAAKKYIAKRSAEIAAKGVSQKAALELATKEAAKRFAGKEATAATAGAFAGSTGLETGSIYGDIKEQTGQDRAGTALLYGSLAGAVEVVPSMRILRRLGFGKQADAIAKKAIEKVGDGALTFAGKQMLLEGGTEVVQTILERAAVESVDESKDIFTEEGWAEIINAGILGGLAGGVVGGGSALLGPKEQKPTLGTAKEKPFEGPQPSDFDPETGQKLQPLDPYKFGNIDQLDTTVGTREGRYVFSPDEQEINPGFNLDLTPEAVIEASRVELPPEPQNLDEYLEDAPEELTPAEQHEASWQRLAAQDKFKDNYANELTQWWDSADDKDRIDLARRLDMPEERLDEVVGTTFAYDDGNPDVPIGVRTRLGRVAGKGALEGLWERFKKDKGIEDMPERLRISPKKAREVLEPAGVRTKVMKDEEVTEVMEAIQYLEGRASEFDSLETLTKAGFRDQELQDALYTLHYHTHDRRNKTDRQTTAVTSRSAAGLMSRLGAAFEGLPERNAQQQAEFDAVQERGARKAAIEKASQDRLDAAERTWFENNATDIADWWDGANAYERSYFLQAAGFDMGSAKRKWLGKPFNDRDLGNGRKTRGLPNEAKLHIRYNLPAIWDDFKADPDAFRNYKGGITDTFEPRVPDRETRIQELEAANARQAAPAEEAAVQAAEDELLRTVTDPLDDLANEIAGEASPAADPLDSLAAEIAGEPTTSSRPAENRAAASSPTEENSYGASNTGVTSDEAEAARQRMLARMGRVRAGIDPEDIKDALILGAYHIEAGARKFSDWVKAFWNDLTSMSQELADKIRPYLARIYDAARARSMSRTP